MIKPKIAIAVSTYNRKDAFLRWCHNMYINHVEESIIFIVDAGSDTNYANTADYKFRQRATISEAKNKCLQLCYESGADHIFIFDDDAWPIHSDWWKPYVNSCEHHLCATFLPYHRIINKMVDCVDSYGRIYQDNISFKSHLLGNGYCLYFTRKCIETVGGFDTNYNNKYEHCDLSRRIFNAGLTKHIYQDVINSNELIYCLDKDNSIQRSFNNREMQDNLKSGYDYFRSQAKSKAFIPFIT